MQQGVKSLMRSLKAKYEIQLQREFERPYMRGKYVSPAHTPIPLGTTGKLVGILYTLSYSRHVCWPAGWGLRELTQQLKTAASRLVAGLEELWEGCGTSNGAENEGGSVSGLVSSLADYFIMYGDQVTMNVIQDAVTQYQEEEHLF